MSVTDPISQWLSVPLPGNTSYDCTNSNSNNYGGNSVFLSSMTNPQDVACWSAQNPTSVNGVLTYNFQGNDILLTSYNDTTNNRMVYGIYGNPANKLLGSSTLTNQLVLYGSTNIWSTLNAIISWINPIATSIQSATSSGTGGIWGFTPYFGSSSTVANAPRFYICSTTTANVYPPPLASISNSTTTPIIAPVITDITVSQPCPSPPKKFNWDLIIIISVIVIIVIIIIIILLFLVSSGRNRNTKTKKN